MGFYQCITYLYQGLQTEDQQQLGARVAYYKAALDKLGETEKLIKGIPKQEVKQSIMLDLIDCHTEYLKQLQ